MSNAAAQLSNDFSATAADGQSDLKTLLARVARGDEVAFAVRHDQVADLLQVNPATIGVEE